MITTLKMTNSANTCQPSNSTTDLNEHLFDTDDKCQTPYIIKPNTDFLKDRKP